VTLIVNSDSGQREVIKIRDRIGLNIFSEMFSRGGNYRRHLRGFNWHYKYMIPVQADNIV